MTREEAIDIFKHITTIIPSQDVTMDDVDTAIAMAISALEQDRPIDCEKCEVGNPCLYCKHDFKEKTNENID